MIQQAKKILKDEKLTCVLLNDGETKTANTMGIKHLIDWYLENSKIFSCGVIADTTVGLAVSSILVFGGIKEVYGEIMSQSAADLLEKHGINFSYGKLVKNIMNREGNAICPMEKICLGTADPEKSFNALRSKIYGD